MRWLGTRVKAVAEIRLVIMANERDGEGGPGPSGPGPVRRFKGGPHHGGNRERMAYDHARWRQLSVRRPMTPNPRLPERPRKSRDLIARAAMLIRDNVQLSCFSLSIMGHFRSWAGAVCHSAPRHK